jgi:hypothetical protein
MNKLPAGTNLLHDRIKEFIFKHSLRKILSLNICYNKTSSKIACIKVLYEIEGIPGKLIIEKVSNSLLVLISMWKQHNVKISFTAPKGYDFTFHKRYAGGNYNELRVLGALDGEDVYITSNRIQTICVCGEI